MAAAEDKLSDEEAKMREALAQASSELQVARATAADERAQRERAEEESEVIRRSTRKLRNVARAGRCAGAD